MQINWNGALPQLPHDYVSQYKTGWIPGTAADPSSSVVVLVRRDHLPGDETPLALDPRDIAGLWDWAKEEWLFIEPAGNADTRIAPLLREAELLSNA